MAVVYRAERADGAYRQQVAIKLLDRRGGSASTERCFERERRLLARLEHPDIARLLDGVAYRADRFVRRLAAGVAMTVAVTA